MRLRLLLPVGCMTLLTLATSGEMAFAASKSKKLPPVTVTTIQQQDVPRIAHTVGTVLASATVQIKSLVEGRVLSSHFTEGQMVTKGDLLFQIDPLPFKADLAKAKAILARDRAQLSKAQRELKRQQNLRKRGVSSVQTFETAKAEALAQAATVASDEAAVDLAALRLGYTQIRAPISGKTGEILVHPGNIVKANADTPMVSVSAISPIRISATLPQKLLPNLQDLMAAGEPSLAIHIPGDNRPPLSGHVDFVAAAVNQQSGTIEIRATVENKDLRLVPGQFVTAALTLRTYTNALTVPDTAISRGQNGPYVYELGPQQKITQRPITITYANNGISVISSQNLDVGDTIIASGQLRLKDGMKVHVLTETPTSMTSKDKGR